MTHGTGQGRPQKLDDYPFPLMVLGMLVAFACAMAPIYLWPELPDILGWRAELREFKAGRDLSTGFLLMMILFGALWAAVRPASWGELGRVALVSFLQNLWFWGAIEAAAITQSRIAPDHYFLVTFAAFVLYAAPAAAAGWISLMWRGILPARNGGVSAPMMAVLALPGLLIAGLALDLVDAAGSIPLLEGLEPRPDGFGRSLYVLPMAAAAFTTLLRARPETQRHWIMLAIATALAMQAAALLWGGAIALYTAIDPQGVWGTMAMAALGAGFVSLAKIAPWLGRLMSGNGGPWPEKTE